MITNKEALEKVKDILKNMKAELSSESVSRIGTAPRPYHDVSIDITVYIPLVAQITSIQGYFRNAAWPDGCGLGDTDWHLTQFDNSYEAIGWTHAGNLIRGSMPTAQFVTATFTNRSDCNPRYARLVVNYTVSAAEEERIEIYEVEKNLILVPYSKGGGNEFPRGI